jgi:nitroreductase
MSNDLHNPRAESPVNDVFRAIYARRSVRDYLPDDVPDDVIRELIRAGTYAQSTSSPGALW